MQLPCACRFQQQALKHFVAVLAKQSECKLPVRKQRCHHEGLGEDSMSFTHGVFTRTHRVREGKSCLSSAPAEITELRESPACLRPLCFCSLEFSIGLKISPWENNSQIASVMGRKITSPSVSQLMNTLQLVGLNRNNFINEVHFFKCSCSCRMNAFSESSLSLIFSLINTCCQLLHLITAQSCGN